MFGKCQNHDFSNIPIVMQDAQFVKITDPLTANKRQRMFFGRRACKSLCHWKGTPSETNFLTYNKVVVYSTLTHLLTTSLTVKIMTTQLWFSEAE